jgi:virulence-associated protein VapD
MFAIAFDLVVVDTETHHPKGISQAYTDIGNTLQSFGFRRIQGSVYVADSENMANLFGAIAALKALPWFPASVRDIRAFRVEQWSDYEHPEAVARVVERPGMRVAPLIRYPYKITILGSFAPITMAGCRVSVPASPPACPAACRARGRRGGGWYGA